MDVDRTEFEDVLSKLSTLRADSWIASREAEGLGADQEIATIRARFGNDDTDEVVVVWRADATTFAVSGEEQGAAQIDSETFDEALEALEAIQTADS